MIVNRTHATVRGRVIAAYPINNTAGGDAVLNFRLAANERQYDPESKTWHDKDTFYVTVSCWDSLARRAAAIALRGQMVVAMGTLTSRNYEKEGQRRSYTELRAQHLAVDIASVETVRTYGETKPPGGAAPQEDSDIPGAGDDPVDSSTDSSSEGTTPAGAAQAEHNPSGMTPDATSATPTPSATSASSPRPEYAGAPAGSASAGDGDKLNSGEAPF